MTKEEAKITLANLKRYMSGDGVVDKSANKAIDMAIEALSKPEIMKCGDGCKFWNRHAGEQVGTCDILRQCTSASFYCGNAKKSEVNNESN